MRLKWVVTCFAIILLCGQVLATEQEQKQEVAEDKAQVLEEKAAEKDSDLAVPKSAVITPPKCRRSIRQAQPLWTMPSPALHAASIGNPKVWPVRTWKPSPAWS